MGKNLAESKLEKIEQRANWKKFSGEQTGKN